MSTATAKPSLPELSVNEAKEYDFMICIDQSGSMGEPSLTLEGRTRWDEAQEFTEAFARFAEQADDDGITLITFNSHATLYDGVKADKVHEIFITNRPSGSTNLAAALSAAFKKKFTAGKKAIILVMTDGRPDSETEVQKVIKDAANKCEHDEDIGVQFIQIGNDKHASEFLEQLDHNLKGAKFDIVNAMSREEAEGLTVEQMLWKSIND
jgi:Mg-chelatase subunit ChlD